MKLRNLRPMHVGADNFTEWGEGVIPKCVVPLSVFSCRIRSWFLV